MKKILFLSLVLLGLVGCSSYSYEYSEVPDDSEIVLETIPAATVKPEWAQPTSTSTVSQDGNYVVSEFNENVVSTQAVSIAENAANLNLIKSVKESLLVKFMSNQANTDQDLVKFSEIVNKMELLGLTKKDSFLEKVQKTSADSVTITYRYYVLMELSKVNFDKNFNNARSQFKSKVKSTKKIIKK